MRLVVPLVCFMKLVAAVEMNPVKLTNEPMGLFDEAN
jgi:hypothetical protein